MADTSIHITREIQSQQADSAGQLIVDLRIGDIVELRECGIYFTRKIDGLGEQASIKTVFEELKRQNQPTEESNSKHHPH
jgi:hypothetical protein